MFVFYLTIESNSSKPHRFFRPSSTDICVEKNYLVPERTRSITSRIGMDLSTQNRGQHRETLPTGTDLADNYDRGTVSSKDEFDDELDEMKKNREIPYPVLKLKIGLRVDRPLTCFVNVKTCADKVSTFIDHTETLDYAGNGDEFFKREVEVMYYVGIDERQILVFEIHDGDKYHHRSGYLWASVSIPVAIMLSNQDHVPIYRGDDVLGYLLFGVEIIEKQKLVSLMDEDALGLRY